MSKKKSEPHMLTYVTKNNMHRMEENLFLKHKPLSKLCTLVNKTQELQREIDELLSKLPLDDKQAEASVHARVLQLRQEVTENSNLFLQLCYDDMKVHPKN